MTTKITARKRTINDITNAFLTLLTEKRYKDITVGEILFRCGYSKSTFYAHFANKDDCMKRIIDEEVERYMNSTVQAFKKEDGEYPGFRHDMTLSFFQYVYDHRLFYNIMLSRDIDDEDMNQFYSYFTIKIRDNNYNSFSWDLTKDFHEMAITVNVYSFFGAIEYWHNNKWIMTPREITDKYFDIKGLVHKNIKRVK